MPENDLSKTDAPTENDSLRRLFFGHLPDEEMPHLLAFCRKHGLDPWLNHVWPELRWDPSSQSRRLFILVKIDGLRSRAAKTGEYAGNDAAVFNYASEADHPDSARATVYRYVRDQVRAYTAEARFDEFYPAGGDTSMWDKMPCVMLGKCAEAHALRKAFPELAGLYTPDEMGQALMAGDDEPGEAHSVAPQSFQASAASMASTTSEPPETQRQLLLRMVDAEIPAWRRPGIIAGFREKWPQLLERDEAAFARKVWAAIRMSPAEYGVPSEQVVV